MPVVIRGSGEDPEILSGCWGGAVTPVPPCPHSHHTELLQQTGDEMGLNSFLTGTPFALQCKYSYTEKWNCYWYMTI